MKNLQDKLANINKAKVNTPSVSKPIIQEVVVKKRIGRPTFKSEEIEYSRIFADIPTELKDRMTVALIQKYKGQFMIEGKLSDKIIKGGGGVWGEQPMAAHPQVSKADATEMVKYILSLADDKKTSKPVKGEYLTKDNGKEGTYMFSASYTDKGANKMASQTGSKTFTLRSAKIKANTFDTQKETMKYKIDGLGEVVIALNDKGYVAYNDIDFSGIGAFKIMAVASDDRTVGGKVEIRIDSPTGQLLGTGDVEKGTPKPTKVSISP